MKTGGMITVFLALGLVAGSGHAQQATSTNPAAEPRTGSGQGYPNKPIRLIVPFPAGGQTDVVARTVAQKMTESLGQQVVVDNRPGAAGSIGVDIALKAPADGYTMLQVSTSYAANVALYKLNYDPVNDVVPVIMIGDIANIVTVNPTAPFKSVKELIAYARRIPAKSTSHPAGLAAATTLPPRNSRRLPASA